MTRPSPGAGWTVLITGASSGLGRALAVELARKGCSLVLTGRDQLRLQAVEAEVRAAGAPWVGLWTGDLADEGGAEELISACRAWDRPVDALVNNAGAGRAGPWSSGTSSADRALWRLLVDTPLTLTRAFLEPWRSRGRGALLNVASTGAFQPGPLTSVYYAAKAALLSWSVALAREERAWLTVTTLCPGALKTGFSAAAGKHDVPGAPGPGKTAKVAIRAWVRGKGLVIPGVGNRSLVLASRLLPPAVVAAGVEALQRSVRKR